MKRHPELVIGLIPCAKNSSAIIEWPRNLSDQSLYGSCLKRVRAASPMGEVSGILFFQGEQDSIDPYRYPQLELYPGDRSRLFSKFVFDFRSNMNQPELPVVFSQIGTDPVLVEFPNWTMVQNQQASVVFPVTAMIVTNNLPLMDGIYFTADSYHIIGKRFAETFWDLAD